MDMERSNITMFKSGSYTAEDLNEFRSKHSIWKEVDIYESQLEELLEVLHPDVNKREVERDKFNEKYKKGELEGVWVYYPWSGIFLHTVGENELYTLRTNRNKNLISMAEQNKISNSTVGIIGMSVGASIAIACAHLGVKNIRISDFDNLETANLNRVRESLANVNQPKTSLIAQRILELDPFINLDLYAKGVDESNIHQFLKGLDVVVDEFDDFKMKIILRNKAKEARVAVMMFTSLGDTILVDVERFDLDNRLPIFNGLIGDVPDKILASKNLTVEDIRQYSISIVGLENVPLRAIESLKELGKSLVGRPQLYSTIAVDGGLASYLIREHILNGNLQSGRYRLDLSNILA